MPAEHRSCPADHGADTCSSPAAASADRPVHDRSRDPLTASISSEDAGVGASTGAGASDQYSVEDVADDEEEEEVEGADREHSAFLTDAEWEARPDNATLQARGEAAAMGAFLADAATVGLHRYEPVAARTSLSLFLLATFPP